MRERLHRITRGLAEALTVHERWLAFLILLIVVTGAFVKYCRARPEKIPPSGAAAPPATTFPDDD
jgi:hypothetical protein